MHICVDEVKALVCLVPMLALLWAWVKAKLHHRKHHGDCKSS